MARSSLSFMSFSRLVAFYYDVVGFLVGCYSIGGIYLLSLFFLLLSFLFLRFPYIFGLWGFGLFLLTFVFPLFLGLMMIRLELSVSHFFASFIPLGTPLWISPFVCLAETVSYVVRPVVLIIRPFLNLSIGALGGASLGSMCINYTLLIVFFLLILFLYEIFVALVHWFIVCNILSFSKDH